VLAGLLVAARLSVPPWPKRLPDVRIEPSRPILREEALTTNNAFYFINAATNFDKLPSIGSVPDEYKAFRYIGWSSGAYTQLEAIVMQNTPVFELLRRAAEMTNAQVVTAGSVTSLVSYVSTALKQLKTLCFLAEWEAGRGDWKSAAADYRTVLHVSDQLSRGGPLISVLVDYACSAVACQSMRRATLASKTPPAALKELAGTLLDIDRHVEPLAEAMRYERLASQDAVRMVRGGDVPRLMSLDGESHGSPWRVFGALCRAGLLRSTPAHFDAVYSQIIALADEPWSLDRTFRGLVPPFPSGNPVRFVGALLDDPVGRVLINILVPALDNAREVFFIYRARLRGTALFLAVRAYQLDHRGQPPVALADLAPGYIDGLPADPFGKGGARFAYSVTGDSWMVYSVGPNQRDDEGRYDWNFETDRRDHADSLDVCFSSAEFARERDEYLKRSQPPASVK